MYDCLIVGGGIAGLQAAIQLGRYRHKVLVVDKGIGRSTWCRSYHNILGWPDGISGPELRRLGRQQAEKLGVEFRQDEVIAAAKNGKDVEAACASGGSIRGKTLLVASGVTDRFPPIPGLMPCLGLSVYVCPDCDGYETRNRRTIVLGSGPVGANMALTLKHWTDKLVYVNHERAVVGSELLDRLQREGIEYFEEEIESVVAPGHGPDGAFGGVRLRSGGLVSGERGFIAFGGNEVHSDWTRALGLERLDNWHIVTDPRTKQTNVPGIWAAGDIGVHAEQVTVAMGEGALSAIWIHKELQQRLEAAEQGHGPRLVKA
ncbi:NAD(P)/FAD-dependent oxidoreductase [Paenibacillus filicis]|uniref:NAD(P)/FAD-dependent oxidoreductase n=1 Tax=Paenibacillus gyeongsangnamensis TaxID=3388067 RepID=A0ABT4Q8S8_9BACL|nr:NAD(P)/FAD-dependent oxidoreductase [Paenibacillus filicis]MCZ8513282.1 NAD(P)/FAD-dependent oxidoreductase [Paenibacillus filicis]